MVIWGSHGLMVESQSHNPNVAGSSLRSGREWMEGEGMYSALHLQYHDEVLLSKAPNPNCSPDAGYNDRKILNLLCLNDKRAL